MDLLVLAPIARRASEYAAANRSHPVFAPDAASAVTSWDSDKSD